MGLIIWYMKGVGLSKTNHVNAFITNIYPTPVLHQRWNIHAQSVMVRTTLTIDICVIMWHHVIKLVDSKFQYKVYVTFTTEDVFLFLFEHSYNYSILQMEKQLHIKPQKWACKNKYRHRLIMWRNHPFTEQRPYTLHGYSTTHT